MSLSYPVGYHPCPEGQDPGPCWIQPYCDGEQCEPISEYSDGKTGLCPVLLGDILEGIDLQDGTECSFHVIGKLGHGSYSTVWLHLALKILRAEHSTRDNMELKILQDTGRLNSAFFYTHTPTNRQHLCLVMKAVGCPLKDRSWAKPNGGELGIPWDVLSAAMLTEMLLLKVFEIHEVGIYHGDISPSNVALGLAEDAFTPKSLKWTFSEDLRAVVHLGFIPLTEPQPPVPPFLPAYIAYHVYPLASDGLDVTKIDIIDFGQGGYESKNTKLRGTRGYKPPESKNPGALGSIQSDLWSLGCLVYYALTDIHLFGPDEEFVKAYTAASDQEQISYIDVQLRADRVFQQHVEYRDITARLLHSLLRVDPAKRSATEAKKWLVKMVEYANQHMEGDR
ncbi:serine/threonine protein kinase [Trichophyton rubrum D6]|nr:serine/threonine protein kinase [Trichophyton rubrum MR850]EZF37304.1 serine/threonine protein kinase [Trichophyton rubrum CBS 100081]EZF47928.1 serine/threonine protein kinase [Trichophyton rubrum CBS 288.86]EZF58551.1 serine/threonine protein kinase [Trichophyton rubrum CBS 289.86]EZF79931.1 serine/threonine protein kinase [Trichophyton rubrum MR1448]EZG12133.1 serine/threonine protein kinase [Trichophyton rubrum CBS 202.88]KDB29058.1 serine/threonine protein kinase [Trichophyton rubrum 